MVITPLPIGQTWHYVRSYSYHVCCKIFEHTVIMWRVSRFDTHILAIMWYQIRSRPQNLSLKRWYTLITSIAYDIIKSWSRNLIGKICLIIWHLNCKHNHIIVHVWLCLFFLMTSSTNIFFSFDLWKFFAFQNYFTTWISTHAYSVERVSEEEDNDEPTTSAATNNIWRRRSGGILLRCIHFAWLSPLFLWLDYKVTGIYGQVSQIPRYFKVFGASDELVNLADSK